MDMVESNMAYCVRGNHEDKLRRKLQGRDVKITHGLDETLEQLADESDIFKERVQEFLGALKAYYIFDTAKLVVSHAGLSTNLIGTDSKRAEAFCLYGQTTNEYDEYGFPIRYDWAKDYKGQALIVYGHTPVSETKIINNTINIDSGCVFGGKLTAFRYPEMTILSQPAFRQYQEHAKNGYQGIAKPSI
jgi:protein phosphatase